MGIKYEKGNGILYQLLGKSLNYYRKMVFEQKKKMSDK